MALIPREDGVLGEYYTCVPSSLHGYVYTFTTSAPWMPAPYIPVAFKETSVMAGGKVHTHSMGSARSGNFILSPRTVYKEETEGNAEGALETFKYINDFANDSFGCILIISLYKGNFLKTDDWAGQPTQSATV